MATSDTGSGRMGPGLTPAYDRIAKRIGIKLREVYGSPEAEPLPDEHVSLLLRLRHKERDRARAGVPV